jgi:hypothetical protein
MYNKLRPFAIHITVGVVFLSLIVVSLWVTRSTKPRQEGKLTYEQEIELVHQHYQPLRFAAGKTMATMTAEEARKFYEQEIAEPFIRDLNEIRNRHGKPPVYVRPDSVKYRASGKGTPQKP